MAKRTIIFRADGNSTIGVGHFIRTLALAEMLSEYFHCIFATQKPSEYQIGEIDKVCHERIELPEDDSHFESFLSLLQGDEIVVLDNYYFDTKYQRAIKAKNCKLACIVDIYDKHYVADIVIDHTEGISSTSFSIEPYTQLLLGYDYALIRKEFREQINASEEKKYAGLIMIGGADPYGITNKFLDALEQFEFDKPVAVIRSVLLKNKNNNSDDKFRFFDKLNAKEVAQLMSASDFGIFPASTVAIEACAVRLPFICGYFVDNQMELYKTIKTKKLALCVGDFNTLDPVCLIHEMKKLHSVSIRNEFIEKQSKAMDNNSNRRLIRIFREL